jgi:uncharacterized membrane protein
MIRRRFRCVAPVLAGVLLGGCSSTGGVTFDQAANATYEGILDTPLTLIDGHYEGNPYVEGGASRPTVRLAAKPMAAGDVDGDGIDELVVVLAANFGGSGSYTHLATVTAGNGQPRSFATVLLGDRIQVRSLAVHDRAVIIESTEHDSDDAMCCPSLERRHEWNPETGSIVDLSAADGFARYRGHIVIGHEARAFTECDSGREAWIIDATNGDLGAIYSALAVEPYQPLYFEVGATWQGVPEAGFAADFNEAIRIHEVRQAEREGFGCRANPAAFAFRANGNEPSWRIEVRESGLSFAAPGQDAMVFPSIVREDSDNGTRISASSAGADIELIVSAERCTDSMSGSIYPLTAEVRFGESTFRGCAMDGALR